MSDVQFQVYPPPAGIRCMDERMARPQNRVSECRHYINLTPGRRRSIQPTPAVVFRDEPVHGTFEDGVGLPGRGAKQIREDAVAKGGRGRHGTIQWLPDARIRDKQLRYRDGV